MIVHFEGCKLSFTWYESGSQQKGDTVYGPYGGIFTVQQVNPLSKGWHTKGKLGLGADFDVD